MTRLTCLVFAAVAMLAVPAVADSPAVPWSVGVTAEQKARAKQFLDAGNALLLEKKYAPALEEYKAAVGEWDHPAIRFNIVRCLIQLDRLPEASDNLKLALKYGAAPLEDAIYNEALAYEKLLAKQTGELAITCEQGDVKLTLDGKALHACPTKETQRVTPGAHQIVGTKAGLLTQTVEVFVVGGKQQRVAIHLQSLASAARIEHRWASWVPWVVFGTGFGLAGIGGAIQLSAASDRDSFDRTVQQNCTMFTCSDAELDALNVRGLDDSARLKGGLAAGFFVVGGATIVTGAVMLYLNRGRTVYPESVQRLTPSINAVPGGGTVSLGGPF